MTIRTAVVIVLSALTSGLLLIGLFSFIFVDGRIVCSIFADFVGATRLCFLGLILKEGFKAGASVEPVWIALEL